MLNIQMPPIHEGITLNKDNEAHPSNYVHVIDGVAIVVGVDHIFCFDIKNHFIDSQLIEYSQKDEFAEFMSFLEGKSFSKEFWKELTSNSSIKVLDEDTLYLENDKISKNIFYMLEENINITGVLKILKNACNHQSLAHKAFSINPKMLASLIKCFGKKVQTNSLIIEGTVSQSHVRFTFDNMPHIFGMFSNNVDVCSKAFNFSNYQDFSSNNE